MPITRRWQKDLDEQRIRDVTITDGEVVEVTREDVLIHQLRESINRNELCARNGHPNKRCLAVHSNHPTDTCTVSMKCPDCGKLWTDELTQAEMEEEERQAKGRTP